jgi:hypothetical protein
VKSATGRWVSADDFFDRQHELRLLESRVCDGNHILLTGQRRMGKTSIARELGRRLESQGWTFLFADVEAAADPESVIAELARALHPVQAIRTRFAGSMRQLIDRVEEISALDFSVKIRAGIDAGSWQRHGTDLLASCAGYEQPVLLTIDELPIFLERISRGEDGVHRVDEFLSWLRRELLTYVDGSLVVILSGSIGLRPLVERLGLPDRINHLDPFRLGPWDRDASVACFEALMRSYGLTAEDGVPGAVYDSLGIGIPNHVQSFFARLRDHVVVGERTRITREDVTKVYKKELLGPSGQIDLVHYEARLREGLDDDGYVIAMEILAEAATQSRMTPDAQRCLVGLYSHLQSETRSKLQHALDVLVHDGYVERQGDDYAFTSNLLRDWWAARFRAHHIPVCDRSQDGG